MKRISTIIILGLLLMGAAHYWGAVRTSELQIANDGDTDHGSITRTAGGGLTLSEPYLTITGMGDGVAHWNGDVLTALTVSGTLNYDPTNGTLDSTVELADLPETVAISPATTVDEQVARFDGVAGDLQGSAVTIADTGDITVGADGGGNRYARFYSATAGKYIQIESSGSTGKVTGAGQSLSFDTGGSGTFYLNCGAYFTFRDRDGTYAVRLTIDSANGDIDNIGGTYKTNGTTRIDASGNYTGGTVTGSTVTSTGRLVGVGVTNSGTVILTPTAAVLDADTDAIPVTAALIRLEPDAARALTSTPTMANGTEGQVVRMYNRSAYQVTILDQGTLAGSNVLLNGESGAISATVGYAEFLYNGNDWICLKCY